MITKSGFSARSDPQRFLAVGSLQQPMPVFSEQRRDKAQIDRSVLDGKNRGHDPPWFASGARKPLGPLPDKRCE